MTERGTINLIVLSLTCIVPVAAIGFVVISRRRRAAAGAIAVDGGYLFPSATGLRLQPARLINGLALLLVGLFALLALVALLAVAVNLLSGTATSAGQLLTALALPLFLGGLFVVLLRQIRQPGMAIDTAARVVRLGDAPPVPFAGLRAVVIRRGATIGSRRSIAPLVTLEVGVRSDQAAIRLLSVSGAPSSVIEQAINVVALVVGNMQGDWSDAPRKHLRVADWDRVMAGEQMAEYPLEAA